MGFLGRSRKKKIQEQSHQEITKTASNLELLCGDDKEVYEALSETMLLNPTKMKESIEEAAEKAKDFEKSGDAIMATTWYRFAGGLAIFQGDVKKVKECFTKCQELSGRSCPILKIPEKAVAKAQEYYQKYLKK